MEGAALHYACIMEHIPFIQLRAVSNFVGERDKNKLENDGSDCRAECEIESNLP